MSVDPRAMTAALNNADLYEAVFTAHGLAYQRHPYAFVASDTPPPYYSNLTVIQPGQREAVLSQIVPLAARFGGRLSLKDSFCEHSLESQGLRTLFEASWIWRPPVRRGDLPDGWRVMTEEADLALWETALKRELSPTAGTLFPTSLLDNPRMIFLGRQEGGQVTLGCLANLSKDCVGLSNVFAQAPSAQGYSEAVEAAATMAKDLPLVGYESGPSLGHAISAGCEPVGQLRVLVKDAGTG